MNALRIEKIINESIGFPLFIENENEDISSAYYVTGVHNEDVNGMPMQITISRENSDGVITDSVYELQTSIKFGEGKHPYYKDN